MSIVGMMEIENANLRREVEQLKADVARLRRMYDRAMGENEDLRILCDSLQARVEYMEPRAVSIPQRVKNAVQAERRRWEDATIEWGEKVGLWKVERF